MRQKSYDIIGRTCEGAFYCSDCCKNEELDPVFAGSEGQFVCDQCFEVFGFEKELEKLEGVLSCEEYD